MREHYETLGVQENATTEEIKRSFHDKAKTAHPDVGGSPDEFKKLNMAYLILKNPETRRKYDAGQDPDIASNSSLSEGQKVLMEMFNSYLQNLDYMEAQCPKIKTYVINEITKLRTQHEANKNKCMAQITKLNSKKGKLTTTSELNLFELLIDNQIDQLNKRIFLAEEHIKVLNSALIVLELYNEAFDPSVRSNVSFSVFGEGPHIIYGMPGSI